MGGKERPPRPRLLQDSSNGEEDTDVEWTDEEVEAAPEIPPTALGDGGTPKELSREGAHFGQVDEGGH